MGNDAVRACVRCHTKKIKCDGQPNCQTCIESDARCEPYTRLRRVEAYKSAQKRLAWLEEEISSALSVDCQSLKTGTSLKGILRGSHGDDRQPIPARPSRHGNQELGEQRVAREVAAHADSPELSLLTLNATGELRYLGPSSGSFFANYIASLARKLGPTPAHRRQRASERNYQPNHQRSHDGVMTVADVHKALTPHVAQLLSRSFQLWILPIYPLFSTKDLDGLVAQCSDPEASSRMKSFEQNRDMIIFFLVMALGAINSANTIKETEDVTGLDSSVPSANHLYGAALNLFEHNVHLLRPSVFLIQILDLISIYSSYGPSGLSQWQLSGMATRMAVELGLHCSYFSWQMSDLDIDRRNRAFWTSFILEITLAYNLGRPPSITDDHINANLPEPTEETLFGIQHIKHRRIQNRIISSVYCTNPSKSHNERLETIQSLQTELDDWRSSLEVLYQQCRQSAYPFSFWERLHYSTSFVLHRSSPLCPQPSLPSAEHCIRSAGAYLDNILAVLRNSNVPITWMIVQGVIFAGLTILVTARTTAPKLVKHSGPTFLLVDLANWTRKCSLCLTIINERWSEDLISKLDAQYEMLALDTLQIFATAFTGKAETKRMADSTLTSNLGSVVNPLNSFETPVWMADSEPSVRASPPIDWQTLEPFSDFLGWDNGQAFWNIFPSHSGFDVFDALGAEAGQRQETYLADQYGAQDWTNMYLG